MGVTNAYTLVAPVFKAMMGNLDGLSHANERYLTLSYKYDISRLLAAKFLTHLHNIGGLQTQNYMLLNRVLPIIPSSVFSFVVMYTLHPADVLSTRAEK